MCFVTCTRTGIDVNNNNMSNNVKGVLHFLPQKALKLACFVLYLKFIKMFLKNDIYMHLITNCPKNSKIASKLR